MSSLPKKCLVDTNVPIVANLALKPDSNEDVPCSCIASCIEAIQHVTINGKLAIDEKGEIFNEYLKHLSLRGQPGIGDMFVKWIHDNQWNSKKVDRVIITKCGDSYDQFPDHDGLKTFDNSDRKFVAVSNAHPDKPPILQAKDSKWWGWKDALSEVGIPVHFLCQSYIEAKYAKKMGT